MSKFLLQNISTDTNGDLVRTDGGSKTVAIWATSFGGGTVTLQGSPDNGTTWITLTKQNGNPATFTSNEIDVINRLGQSMGVRATLTGSTGASGVNVQIFN